MSEWVVVIRQYGFNSAPLREFNIIVEANTQEEAKKKAISKAKQLNEGFIVNKIRRGPRTIGRKGTTGVRNVVVNIRRLTK